MPAANTNQSDSEDSEVERQKEEERKKEEELQAAEKSKAPASVVSATETAKPTSTPGTPSKAVKTSDAIRKGILKRPGSPNLSEASGSESSRVKKLKKKHPGGDVNNTASTISRPSSPANIAGSDAEMSDGSAQAKKLKIRLTNATGARPGTPSESRPSSPAVAPVLPTPEEIKALIPPQGMHLADVIKRFKNEKILRNPEFLPLMTRHTRWDKVSKMFYPKGS